MANIIITIKYAYRIFFQEILRYIWCLKWSETCSVVSNSLRLHGILQARILEWVTFPFSKGSFQPTDRTQVSRIAGGFFTSWAIREAHTWCLERTNSDTFLSERDLKIQLTLAQSKYLCIYSLHSVNKY